MSTRGGAGAQQPEGPELRRPAEARTVASGVRTRRVARVRARGAVSPARPQSAREPAGTAPTPAGRPALPCRKASLLGVEAA